MGPDSQLAITALQLLLPDIIIYAVLLAGPLSWHLRTRTGWLLLPFVLVFLLLTQQWRPVLLFALMHH